MPFRSPDLLYIYMIFCTFVPRASVWVHLHLLALHWPLLSIMNTICRQTFGCQNYLRSYPLKKDLATVYQGPENFHMAELPDDPPRPNQYPTRTGKLITYMHIKQPSPSFILNKLLKTKYRCQRLLKYTWWLLFVKFSIVEVTPSFGGGSSAVRLCCG